MSTATHYEVLGVSADASHDEIKRAYLDRALKHHPDRQAEQTPEARERAEFHMREVNRAWEVLRSPGKRAEYDARLRGVTPVWEQRRASVRRTVPVTPQVADLEPDRPSVTPARSRGWRIGPIAFVLIAVIGLLGFAAWATTSSDDGHERDVEVEAGIPLQAGDCVTLVSLDGRITPVPGECSSIGALRIVAVVDLGRPCVDGSRSFDLQPDELRLCLRPSS